MRVRWRGGASSARPVLREWSLSLLGRTRRAGAADGSAAARAWRLEARAHLQVWRGAAGERVDEEEEARPIRPTTRRSSQAQRQTRTDISRLDEHVCRDTSTLEKLKQNHLQVKMH